MSKRYSQEWKDKISKSLTGRHLSKEHIQKLKNRRLTDEERKIISIKTKDAMKNPEIRKKISESIKGNIAWNKGIHMWKMGNHPRGTLGKTAWNKGIKMTQEQKDKNPFWLKSPLVNGGKKSEEHKKKIGLNTKKYRWKQVLPIQDTSIELKIQNFLIKLGIEFYTHFYVKKIYHSYQCDIFIPSKNLIIECDGNYWHNYPNLRRIDKIRTTELINNGFKVIRLWESEIKPMELQQFKMGLENVI